MAKSTNTRIGIIFFGITYDVSSIIDIFYNTEKQELIIEFQNKKEDRFDCTSNEAEVYKKLFNQTFNKIYE